MKIAGNYTDVDKNKYELEICNVKLNLEEGTIFGNGYDHNITMYFKVTGSLSKVNDETYRFFMKQEFTSDMLDSPRAGNVEYLPDYYKCFKGTFEPEKGKFFGTSSEKEDVTDEIANAGSCEFWTKTILKSTVSIMYSK